MSIHYYGTFSPVPLAGQELARRLESVLTLLGISISTDVDVLEWQRNKFVYTFEEREHGSLAEAIAFIEERPKTGVEVHFTYRGHACSVLVWNDVARMLTVTFCEPSSLFGLQQEDARERSRLAALLMELMRSLDADFCIFEAESVFRSRTQSELEKWLENLPAEAGRDWAMVTAKDRTIPQAKVPARFRTGGNFSHWASPGVWLLSLMGEVRLLRPGLARS